MESKQTKTNKPPPLELLGATGAADYEAGHPERYVPSLLPPLDAMILGAVAGELVLIAGKPGDGKTSLAMQWAVSSAQNGVAAGVLSLEMGRRSLLNRLVSGMTGIPMPMLRTRSWASPAHKRRAIEAAELLASIPLYVDDRSGLDAPRVYDTIRYWGQQGIQLVVVDYVQRMGGASDSRNQQVGDAVRALKSGAKDADVPVIAISSLNRQGSGSEKPKMSWLRESGDLEYEADTVLMFHYPEDDENEDVRACDIHVIKQRNGPTGVASVQFNKPATRFEELQ
jgi:replicative DNA helicase